MNLIKCTIHPVFPGRLNEVGGDGTDM